jgi:hypothetical protein
MIAPGRFAARSLALLTLASAIAVAPLAAQNAAVIQPTPRTADGKPDLNGVYQASSRRGGWDAEAPGEQPGVAAPRSATPVNVATRDPIPFQDWAREKAQEYLNRRSIDDPTTFCIPQPSPRMTPVGLFPIEFVQTPTKLVILYEYFGLYRSIPIGASHPDDMEPAFMGNPVARWDGDTLVIEAISFKEGGWVANGVFTSDALRITERFTRVDRDQLNYEAIVDDPKVFTKPWSIRATLMLREGARLREYSCAENNLDPDRYREYLKNPSLFTRTPPPAAR